MFKIGTIWSRYLRPHPLFRDRIMPMIASPTRRRLARGAFWNGIGSVVSRGSVLATSFVLARILGQSGFGEYGVVNSTAAMLGSLAGFGVGTTATKYIAQFRQSDKNRAGRIISLSSMITWISGLLYGMFILVFASWLANRTLAAPQLATVLRISAISVALGVINGTQVSALAGFEAYRKTAILNGVCTLVQAFLVIAGAYFYALTGAIAGLAISAIIQVVLSRHALVLEMRKFDIRNWWYEAWKEWRILVSFSLPAFLTTVIAGPVFWACNALLANQPNGYAELGIFNASNQWYAAIQFLPGLMMTSMLPILSENHGTDTAGRNVRITSRMMQMSLLIVVPVVLGISLMSRTIMRGYGAGFVNGYSVLILSAVTAGIHAVITPVWIAIMAEGRMWICFVMNLGCSLFMLAGMYFLARHGAFGFAAARLISYIAHAVWLVWYATSRRELPAS